MKINQIPILNELPPQCLLMRGIDEGAVSFGNTNILRVPNTEQWVAKCASVAGWLAIGAGDNPINALISAVCSPTAKFGEFEDAEQQQLLLKYQWSYKLHIHNQRSHDPDVIPPPGTFEDFLSELESAETIQTGEQQ